MQPTTITGINSTNYNQPGYYYTLKNNNNMITVFIINPTTPEGNNFIEVTMDNNIWLQHINVTQASGIYNYTAISGIRINPDPTNAYDFIMQISEGGFPVSYMGVG